MLARSPHPPLLLNREAQFVLDLIGQGIAVVFDFPLTFAAAVEAFDLTGAAHADTGTTAFVTLDDPRHFALRLR
jgi:hypothetical protein